MTSATDNRTTELLRKLLDEHGARYEKPEDDTTIYYDDDGNRYTYNVNPDSGWAQLFGYNLTPEQAIAATLGDPTCEYVIEDNMNETEGMGDVWFRCTNCGTCYDIVDDWLLKMPHCPKCGATVKGVR